MKRKLGYYDNEISSQELIQKYKRWQQILSSNFSHKASQEHQFESVELNLPNQRVVNMDVARTRMNILTPQLSKNLQKLLTLYCKNNHILYKQGMNEIMVPFLLFTKCEGIPYQEIYWMFDSFFNKYLLNLYFDEEFNSLQFLFRMIGIILQYHDPGLAKFLQTNDLTPELYSTPWFMTLFANKLSLKMIYLFWEIYILQDDQFLIFYIIVGLLIYKKTQILQTRQSQLPQFLTELIFQTPQVLLEVYRLALLIRKSTPKSLIIFCYQNGIFEKWENFDRVKKIFQHIDKISLFIVLPLQLVVHIYGFKEQKCPMLDMKCIKGQKLCQFCKFQQVQLNTIRQQNQDPFLKSVLSLSNDIRKMDNLINFVVIDVRLKKSKILIDCEIIDIEEPMENIEENFTHKYLEWRGRYHFIFLFSEFRFDDLSKCHQKQWKFCTKFIHILYSLGFQHLGILQGGFLALEAQIRLEIQRSKDHQDAQDQKQNIIDYFVPLDQKIYNYYSTHGILKPIELQVLPSVLASLQNICVDPHTKFFIGKDYTILMTRHLFIKFVNSSPLKQIIIYLSNSKSAAEYLIGVTKYDPDASIKIISIFFLRYTTKVLVKSEPSHLALHLVPPPPNKQYYLSEHLQKLNEEDPLRYLASLKDSDYYEIYRRNSGQGQKLKVIFQNEDTKELTEFADFIKKNFQMLQSKYQSFNNKK